MMFKPLFNRIVVSTVTSEAKTPGGLFIPEKAQEKPNTGVVLAVGNGRANKNGTFTPLQVKVGDKVLFGKYAGTELKLKDEKFTLLTEDEVIGIIE